MLASALNPSRRSRSVVRIALNAGSALAALALATPALAQDADDNGGLEEIIVTAQKREQSVQDVPIAVTAVTQETLQANRIMTVNDLGSIAPGVTVRPSAGGVQVPSFTIRGQNSFGVVAGSDKQVSIYLDGVYIATTRGSIFDLPDIQRLEVLRGPQGTLFGRNATAGAVSIVTRDPTGEPHVRAEATIGNRDQYRMRMSVDLPQIGPFSGYFSFMRNFKHGDIINAGAGTTWDRSLSPGYGVARSPKYLGTIDSNSYFAALKFEASDTFRMVYKYDRNEDAGTPEGTSLTSYDPAFSGLGPSAGLVAPIINAVYNNNNIYLNPTNRRPETVTNSWVIPREGLLQGHSLTATWQASDNITVKNIASYRSSRLFAASAIDGVSALTFPQQAVVPFATLSAISTLGAGFFALPPAAQGAVIGQFAAGLQGFVGGRTIFTASQSGVNSKQKSDELQINYDSDRLHLTAGALWFSGKDEIGGPEGMQNTPSLTLPPLPASGVFRLGNEGRYFTKQTSIAAYLQAEYKMTDQLEVVLGGRVTRDKKSSRFRWDSLESNGTILARPTIVPPTYKKTKPNYLIGLNYKPDDDTLVYAKYSTSFVSGGSVAGIDFDPETAESFELGLKADFLDRRLRTNLALFHVLYKGYQQPSSTSAPEQVAFLNARYPGLGAALAPNLSTFVQQAHDVKAKGFELEVTAAPASGLVTGGSVSYTDSKFTNIDGPFLATQGGEYRSFARPKWTGNVFASYESPQIGGGEMTFNIRADALYRSRMWFVGNPSVRRAAGIPENTLSSPGHWKLNGRLALKNIQLGGVDAEVALWGRNITDAKFPNSVLQLPWGTAGNYDQARTYGVDLSIEF